MHFVNCTPDALRPEEKMVNAVKKTAAGTGGSVQVASDPASAVEGANVVYTDVWVSMGEEDKTAERIRLLMPYQVNMSLMKKTGNVEAGRVIFLHCLPAFHDKDTEVTKKSGALEVSDDVFRAPFSRVFDEAENRVHTIKALMVATLAEF
jgi:ornithine carbamoyltransferase